jgi:hypothetical protein
MQYGSCLLLGARQGAVHPVELVTEVPAGADVT